MRWSRLWLLPVVLLALVTGCAKQTAAERAADSYARQEMASAPVNGNLPDYALPPDKLTQADHLMTLATWLHFSAMAWSIVQLVLLFRFGVIGWMRDRAVALGRWWPVQGYAFLAMLLVARTVLNLPFAAYSHRLSLVYGFSVQGWLSWLADAGKSLVLNWLLLGLLALLLYWFMGKFPRAWWLAIWPVLAVVSLALVYLSPMVIDPLFDKFEPLAVHHPALAMQLEKMGVPQDKQFLMLASAKVTTPNAYVTGIGGSKRVVVWDTSLENGSATPEVLWMVGHECGHYVLGHVRNGTLTLIVLMPVMLGLGYWFLAWVLRQRGVAWGIPRQQDWAAMAVLLLAYSLISVVQEPISNTVSRGVEHDADVYGEEAIHGMVADPQSAVQNDMDASGLRALEDPNPSPLLIAWRFNHPATGYRAAFGKAYDPWAVGMEPKYFPRQGVEGKE